MTRGRRLIVTVCPLERGCVALPVRPGERARRLDARAITRHLAAIVAERRLDDRVRVQEGCAGGCAGAGPNISVTLHPVPRPGERGDHVAVGWKSYVSSIAALDCLARVIDDNLKSR